MKESESLDSKTDEKEEKEPNNSRQRLKTESKEEPPKPCLGFRFTEHEKVRMIRTEAAAAEFMKGFGKGRKPCMIDRSHYL